MLYIYTMTVVLTQLAVRQLKPSPVKLPIRLSSHENIFDLKNSNL
jgi:hypothetical protein